MPTTIAAFLQSELGYPASESLTRLGALGGEKIGDLEFFAGIDAARAAIEPWMPLFFVPVAFGSGKTYGLHLRPFDVDARRLAFVAADEPGCFIEVALTVEQLATYSLLGREAGNGDAPPLQSFVRSVDRINALFGKDFYVPGRHGQFHSGDEPLVMIKAFGGTPAAFRTQAVLADEPQEALAFYERGADLQTAALVMHAGAARLDLESGRSEKAATHAARSLRCYHHTSFGLDLEEYFALTRPLAREFPKYFDDDATWQMHEADPRAWAKRAHELFGAGEVARADKLLNDLCHGTGGYGAAVGAFRKHYEALGWSWATALCDLRR